MHPVSLYKLYELGAKLHAIIQNKNGVNAAEMFVPLMDAQAALDILLKGDPVDLDYAREDGNALLTKLSTIFDTHFIDPNTRQFRFPAREATLESHDIKVLTSLIAKFETALAAELSRKAVYAVTKRGLFDSYELAEHAENQFDDKARERMPSAMRSDINLAGRALAFSLPHAMIFHMLQALEHALRLYYETTTGQSAAGFKDSWKECLSQLSKADSQSHIDQNLVRHFQDIDTRTRAQLYAPTQPMGENESTIFFSTACSVISMVLENLDVHHSGITPRYKALQEKVEKVLTDNGIDLDDDAPSSKRARAS